MRPRPISARIDQSSVRLASVCRANVRHDAAIQLKPNSKIAPPRRPALPATSRPACIFRSSFWSSARRRQRRRRPEYPPHPRRRQATTAVTAVTAATGTTATTTSPTTAMATTTATATKTTALKFWSYDASLSPSTTTPSSPARGRGLPLPPPPPLDLDWGFREGLERPRWPKVTPRGPPTLQEGLQDGSR